MKYLEGKVNHLEDFSLTGKLANRPPKNYTFSVNTSQELHAHTNQTKWIVDYGCTHHMAKDASLFSPSFSLEMGMMTINMVIYLMSIMYRV